jgi:hypothetical protein
MCFAIGGILGSIVSSKLVDYHPKYTFFIASIFPLIPFYAGIKMKDSVDECNMK